jgi:ABC-type Zn uptake system ZnuABC Zn-binding protein ZnuA
MRSIQLHPSWGESMKILLMGIMIVFAFAACGQQSGEQASESSATTEAQSTPAAEEAQVDATAATVELSGTLGCGHCTHQIGDSCSAAVQTADGTVYILEGMEAGSEPFDQRQSGSSITVAGTVEEREGVKYMTVDSYTM